MTTPTMSVRFLGALALVLALATTGGSPLERNQPATAENPAPDTTPTIPVPLPPREAMLNPFGPGEELTYSVRFGPIHAGVATMSVVGAEWANGGRCWHLKSTVRSSGFFSGIFPVNDLTESWMDVDSLFSRRFVRSVNEGSYHRHDAVQIDQRRHLAFYFPKGDSVAIEPDTQDMLSVIYFARGLPLQPGQSVRIPGHVNRKNAPIELRVLRRETIDTPAGTFRCGVVEPVLTEAGLFKQEGRVTLWVTDDAYRIPVMIKSKVKVGSISAVLESFRPGTALTGTGSEAAAPARPMADGRTGG